MDEKIPATITIIASTTTAATAATASSSAIMSTTMTNLSSTLTSTFISSPSTPSTSTSLMATTPTTPTIMAINNNNLIKDKDNDEYQILPPRIPEEFDELVEKYRRSILRLNDLKDSKEEIEMKKILQELNNNLEIYSLNSRFNSFFETALPIILKYLECGSKNYIKEHNDSQIRKLVLELITRFPLSITKNFIQQIFPLLYTIIESDNEDNSLISFRIIVDLHKRTQKLSDDAKKFLALIKKIIIVLLKNYQKIFQPSKQYHVQSMEELDLEPILQEIFVATSLQLDNSNRCFTLLPRGINSLKLLIEMPINMILLLQMYRSNINDSEYLELIPLAIELLNLQPTQEEKDNELFNNEIYSEFLSVQIKFFSFIAFVTRTYEDKYQHLISYEKLPLIILRFLNNLTDEMTSLRKDLLYSTRYVITTKYRQYFIKYIDKFFNENIFLGNGWSTRETLRTLAYSILYDFVHHVREHLNMNELNLIINRLSKNLLDISLNFSNNIMTCRLLNNLAETYYKMSKDNLNLLPNIIKIILNIMKIFVKKLLYLNRHVIPKLRQKYSVINGGNLSSSSSSSNSNGNNRGQPDNADGNSNDNATAASATKKNRLENILDFNDNRSNYRSTIDYLTTSFIVMNDDQQLQFGIPDGHNLSIQDCRILIRTILGYLKILSIRLNDLHQQWQLSQYATFVQHQQQQQQANSNAAGQPSATTPPTATIQQLPIRSGYCRSNDIDLLVKLFQNGLKSLEIFNIHLYPCNNQFQLCQNTLLATSGGAAGGQNSQNINIVQNSSMIIVNQNKQQQQQQQNLQLRLKEEKEAMELFCNIFTVLSTQTFYVIIKSSIDFVVKCLAENNNIIQLVHYFLSQKNTSRIFADILTGYLVERMEIMGQHSEMSNLFLKLFKAVFGSVSCLNFENEQMLQPHLQKLVNNSMKMALNAQEPYNYFMLLRALFRSIGGGSHDQLYREFLPMLPSLLQGLNNFQTGIHRQNMKDLFVELCLTIPVRLSSLLPYLPWLMDPLVSALNGAPNLIAQGLRTLELCVDNLQPDFLYAHFLPIRIELMQSLWKTLRYQNDNIAQISFRIIGKLGGTNHRMIDEPQKLEYIEQFRDPIAAKFNAADDDDDDDHDLSKNRADPNDVNHNIDDHPQPHHQPSSTKIPTHGTYSYMLLKFADQSNLSSIQLPVDKIIDVACSILLMPNIDTFYRQQSWEVVKGFLIANIQPISMVNFDGDKESMYRLFTHSSFQSFGSYDSYNSNQSLSTSSSGTSSTSSTQSSSSILSSGTAANIYKYGDEKLRKVHEKALIAMLLASAIKELGQNVINFMAPLVRHYVLVAICQQCGPINASGRTTRLYGMDPLVLIDAMTYVMEQEDKELCKACQFVLRLIIETTTTILGGSIDRACQLPLYEYILERVCSLCYERAWFSKYGGCFIVRYLFERMSLRWLFGHQFIILKAMLYVMMDLSGDLSSGVIEMAKDNMETMIRICGKPLNQSNQLNPDLQELQKKSMNDVVQELLRQITSHNTDVREQAMYLLDVYSRIGQCTVADIIRPHKEMLDDMVPFRKQKLFQQPLQVQIGILDGNTFCITLEPQLFVIDITIAEHQQFFNDIYSICDNDDDTLRKLPCYKNVQSFTKLRKAAIRTLSATCQHLPSLSNKIFNVLYKALISSDIELQECSFECLRNYRYLSNVNQELIRNNNRNFLRNLSEPRLLSPKDTLLLKKLKKLSKLFSYLFNDKLCELMFQHLQRSVDICYQNLRRQRDKEYDYRLQISGSNANNQQPPPNQDNNLDIIKTNQIQLETQIQSYLNLGVEIIDLFGEITAANVNYVELLLNHLVKSEQILDIYIYSQYYQPIKSFMKRFPQDSVEQMQRRMNEDAVFRFFLYALSDQDDDGGEDGNGGNGPGGGRNGSGGGNGTGGGNGHGGNGGPGGGPNGGKTRAQATAEADKPPKSNPFRTILYENPSHLIMILQQSLKLLQQQQVVTSTSTPTTSSATSATVAATTSSSTSSTSMIDDKSLLNLQQQSPQQVPAPASTIDVISTTVATPSSATPIQSPSSSSASTSSLSSATTATTSTATTTPNQSTLLINYQRYQIIKLVSILVKHNEEWLSKQPELVKLLKLIWLSERFHCDHKDNYHTNIRQLNEPKLLLKCLKIYLKSNENEYDLYFQLLRVFIGKYHCNFEFIRRYFAEDLQRQRSIEWKRQIFLRFCEIFDQNQSKMAATVTAAESNLMNLDLKIEYSIELKAKILQYLIIPIFSYVFTNNMNEEFLGPPLNDDDQGTPSTPMATDDTREVNLVSVFLNVLIKETPEINDTIRILIMQLACLIVEHASRYIRPSQISENERIPRSKRENSDVRKLMTYAWPGMYMTKRQDLSKKYYCHLLLAHIISKISIHKKIIKQVFHSLLNAYYPESRAIVFNALEILIPVIPQRINDNYRMMRQLTKKLMIEESHIPQQFNHLLHIIVKYYRIYYPNRHSYVPHITNAIQRYGLSQNSLIVEQRKLALDLVEVIIRWEHERLSIEQLDKSDKQNDPDSSDSESSFDSKQDQQQPQPQHGHNRSSNSNNQPNQQDSIMMNNGGNSGGSIEREYSDMIIQFLFRFICMSPDFNVPANSNINLSTLTNLPSSIIMLMSNQSSLQSSQSQQPQTSSQLSSTLSSLASSSTIQELLCRRAFILLKDILQNEFWPLNDIKLTVLERILVSVPINHELSMLSSSSLASGVGSGATASASTATSASGAATTGAAGAAAAAASGGQIQPNNNIISICLALDILLLLLQVLKRDISIQLLQPLQRAIYLCCMCPNHKVITSVYNLLAKMMSIVPPTCVQPKKVDTLETFEQLYTDIHSLILNGFMLFNKVSQQQQPQQSNQPQTSNAPPGGSMSNISIIQGNPPMNAANITPQQQQQQAQMFAANRLMNNAQQQQRIAGGGQQQQPQPQQPQSQLTCSSTTQLTHLFSVLMCLKAACINEPTYIDRLTTPFLIMLQKLVKEHTTIYQHSHAPQDPQCNPSLCADIISLCLELIKNRIAYTNPDTRKLIVTIFTVLIDKSNEVKVMKTLLRILEEWIKQGSSNSNSNSATGPSNAAAKGANQQQQQQPPSQQQPQQPSSAMMLREKTALIIRIGQNIEKRFHDDGELNGQYLELIHYIYSDDQLKSHDIVTKLEFAFMSGLRCQQPKIRQKFFRLLDSYLKRSLYDRILFIINSQSWDTIALHYWIKQSIELILSLTGSNGNGSTNSNNSNSNNRQNMIKSSMNYRTKLPLPISLISLNNHHDNQYQNQPDQYNQMLNTSAMATNNKQSGYLFTNMDAFASNGDNQGNNVEMMDIGGNGVYDADTGGAAGGGGGQRSSSTNNGQQASSATSKRTNKDKIRDIIDIVCDFLRDNNDYRSADFYFAVAQLCHLDQQLANHVWIQLFPRLYSILNERQKIVVAYELSPFLISGIHQYQRDLAISSVNTFFEAIQYCEPAIKFRPCILRYLSRNHNLWHNAALLLEAEFLDHHPNDNSAANRFAYGLGGLITNDLINQYQMNATPSTMATSTAAGIATTKHSTRAALIQQQHVDQNDPASSTAAAMLNNTKQIIQNLLPIELPQSLNQPYQHECMAALSQIYETLNEQDYWSGVWYRKAHFKETLIAIAYEQQGYFEQAKGAYELAMNKGQIELNNGSNTSGATGNNAANSSIPLWLNDEYLLWESHWIRCSKELNQWDFLKDYGSTSELFNPFLVLESAWRIPDWDAMQFASIRVEQNFPKEYAWKLALYKGYNALCNPNYRDFELAERMIDVATNFLLKEWRKLPKIVSTAHFTILQGAHQVIELNEAHNLNNILYSSMNSTNQYQSMNERPSSELRSLIKTWKNRLPIVADDLSHWSDIFTWRQHHYQMIVSRFEQEIRLQQQQQQQQSNQSQSSATAAPPPPPTTSTNAAASNALCGAHASAQSLIHLAKVARKHFLINVALDQLNRIHTIPKVPIIDCFQKIRQQLKCHLLKHSIQPTGEELQEAMSVIDCTHLHFFQNEMMAEFIALKGYVLMKMNRLDEANKNFSASLQLSDTVVKSWAMWGEFFYEIFCKEPFQQRNLQNGKNAIIAFLHASRHQSESKTRKYLSQVLWLLSYDKDQQLAQTVEQYNIGVPACNWVPWIQQLLHCLIRSEGQHMLTILSQISKVFPEAVYFPTRTLYLSLRTEQREMKYKFCILSAAVGINQQQQQAQQQAQQQSSSNDQLQVSSAILRCTRIMHHQRELHPTLLTSIEGILDQMSWFRENWFEEILRQLRQALAKCYMIAFENRDNVAETVTSPQTLNYIRKLVNTFGMGIDNNAQQQQQAQPSRTSASGAAGASSTTATSATTNTTASETLARRQQSTIQDPDFQKMKQQFANDFDFNVQGSHKLHQLIIKFKKWIKILEAKAKLLPRSWLLEEKCRYLSNFSNQIVDVALPGEYFLPKSNPISIVHIARFMPRVEIITKHNTTARRLSIRGHNGKIYPYLVLNDSSLSEVRREERFLHLLRLLNLYLAKHKETARRIINFTIPRVVPIHGQMRFVQDYLSSLSLIEIYKQHMIRRGSDPDAPIAKYYDRLLSLQTKMQHQNLKQSQQQQPPQVSISQLKEIITDIQTSMASKTLLKEWALQTFSTATEFWHFRKLFTIQLGLAGLLEFAFHLTRLNPDMMYIHRDSGLINIAYYRFDLNDENGELISNQSVPFRLTHSIQNLITEIGINGPLTATMISTASCLTHPNYKVRSILLAILRDEIINWYKRIKSNEKMALITAAITAVANNQNVRTFIQQQAAQQQQQQQNINNTSSGATDDVNAQDAVANNSGSTTDQSQSNQSINLLNTSNRSQQQQQQQFTQQQLADVVNQPHMNEIPELGGEELVNLATKAANVIMSRLQNLSTFDGNESNVATLINTATNPDNLCNMDPSWHPWL